MILLIGLMPDSISLVLIQTGLSLISTFLTTANSYAPTLSVSTDASISDLGKSPLKSSISL